MNTKLLPILSFVSIIGTCYADQIVLGPTKITGDSPFSAALYNSSCFKQQPVVGTLYRSSESETYIAVNPTNPNNLIIGYQVDRFARFGGSTTNSVSVSTDGGKNWTAISPADIPLSNCALALGGNAGNYKPFERVTDPWLAFDSKGYAYFSNLPFDQDYQSGNPGGAIIVTRSMDGGLHWGSLNTVTAVTGGGFGVPLVDKPTIATDASGNIYTLFQQFKINSGSTYLSISTNGGVDWSSTNLIYNTNNDKVSDSSQNNYAETNSSTMVVLSDGTLVSLLIPDFSGSSSKLGVIRSTDKGKSWSKNIIPVAALPLGALNDPNGNDQNGNPIPVRTASGIASIAANKSNDILYVTWSDLDPSGKFSVYASMSTDKGLSWSAPKRVNKVLTADAFIPVVAVSDDGVVGILYFDWRNNKVGPKKPLLTDMWLDTFNPDLTPRANNETRLTLKSFDLSKAPVLNGGGGSLIPGGYFLGDYMGIQGVQSDFVISFVQPTGQGTSRITPDPSAFAIDPYNRQDIYFAKVSTK